MNYLRVAKTVLVAWLQTLYYGYLVPSYHIHQMRAYMYAHADDASIISMDCTSHLRDKIDALAPGADVLLLGLDEMSATMRHASHCCAYALIVEYRFGASAYMQTFYSTCKHHEKVVIPVRVSALAIHNCAKRRIAEAHVRYANDASTVDITKTMLKFAGPKCDFYGSYRTRYRVYVKHVLHKHPRAIGMELIDNKGSHYFYAHTDNEIVLWPLDAWRHAVWA